MYGDGKKQSEENKIKIIRNLLKLKIENEAIKVSVIRQLGQFLNKKKKKIIFNQ